MKHIWLKGAAMVAGVLMGSIGAWATQTWTYDATAMTIGNGDFVLNVNVKTYTDGTGASIKGLEITSIATEGTADTIDFTGFETTEGYRVISVNNKNAWKKITTLKKFIAPDVFYTDMEMFNGNLEEVEVSDRFTVLNSSVFANSSLKKLTPTVFPYVTKVGGSAFNGSLIESISFPKVQTMGEMVFQNCTNLTGDLSFPELTSAGKFSFRNTKITSFSAPKLTQVTEYLLQGNPELTTVVVGDLCWSNFVGGCYANCPKLESITPKPVLTKAGPVTPFDVNNTAYFAKYPLVFMGDNITSIPGSFMKYNSALKYIEIHCDKLTTIGAWAFQSIADGAEILWDGAAPTTLDNAFAGNATIRKKIILKGGKGIDDWKALSYYKEVSDTDKKRDDYPGKKAIGVINGNVWLIDGRQGLCIRIQ